MIYDIEENSDIYNDYAQFKDFLKNFKEVKNNPGNEKLVGYTDFLEQIKTKFYYSVKEKYKNDRIEKLIDDFYSGYREIRLPNYRVKSLIDVDVEIYSNITDLILTFKFENKNINLNLTDPRKADLKRFFKYIVNITVDLDLGTAIVFTFHDRKTRNKKNNANSEIVYKLLRYLESEVSEIKLQNPIRNIEND